MVLSLYTRANAKNILDVYGRRNNYTLFADSDDPNMYYILPEFPNFLPNPQDNSRPSFSMIWYYGKNVKAGGVCTFTVALPLPDINQDNIKKELNAAIKQDEAAIKRAQQIFDMAKTHHDGYSVAADAIANDVGLSPEQANKYYNQFKEKEGYLQFLPTDQNLKIQPIPLLSASVSVKGFGGPDAFQQWQQNGDTTVARFTGTYETTPSMLGDNAAVISFDLSDQGANLFWHALGGPSFTGKNDKPPTGYDPSAANSIVAVTYSVSFDAKLPAATATVTLERDTVVQLIKESRTRTNTWGPENTWQEVVGKKYQQTINNAIKIDVPSSSYLNTEAGKKNIEETLQEWAQAQLQNMIESQLPTVSLNDIRKGGYEQFEVIQNQERTYELSRAISYKVQPQGQLPKLNSLIPEAELHKYFIAINLNDRPYFNLNIIANPPANKFLTDTKIDSLVITQITFAGQKLVNSDGQEVGSIPFRVVESESPKPVKLTGTFDTNQQKIINYSYMVTYTDGTTPYRVNNLSLNPEEDGYYLEFSDAAMLGVLYAILDGQFLPWAVLKHVRIDAKYQDVEESFLLTEAKPTQTLAKALGRKVNESLQYKATFTLKGQNKLMYYPLDGSSYQSVAITTDRNVEIKSPFEGTNLIRFELMSGVDSASLSLKYELPIDSGLTKTFEQVIDLPDQSNKKIINWTVPTPKTGNGTLTIESATTYDKAGESYTPSIVGKRNGTSYKIALRKIARS